MNRESIESMERRANELAAMELLVEHNEGTFGSAECCRKTGSGDPAFGHYHIYVRVGDGRERRTGCDPQDAPGYARGSRDTLAARQKELRELRDLIRRAKR